MSAERAGPATYWLSAHVGYQCRHSGACCSSGWPIPVETLRVAAIDRAVAEGRLSAPPGGWLQVVPQAPEDVAGIFRSERGICVFRQDHCCAVHAGLGTGALPAACLHFPRICLVDDRGVFVTLSHYCPTAADLLLDAVSPLTVVEGPPAVPTGDVPEGLDARGELPPLFDERRLLSLEEYASWEREAVRGLTSGEDPGDALRVLAAGAGGALLDLDVDGWIACVRRAVPPPLEWPDAPPGTEAAWRGFADRAPAAAVAGRYLAARVFASWVAYQGRGLLAIVRGLEAAFAVFRAEVARELARHPDAAPRQVLREALRQADLLLVHYADREGVARLGTSELED
ncbi:MAG: hypothetical protein AB7O67_07915 [Vicinamibacterales bacterium]